MITKTPSHASPFLEEDLVCSESLLHRALRQLLDLGLADGGEGCNVRESCDF
jgi:hypothetical protein